MKEFKQFARYYMPYKGIFFFDLFCAMTASTSDLVVPLVINYLLRTVYLLDNAERIFKTSLMVAAGLVVLFIVRMLAQYYITTWGHIMGARMEADMRGDLFKHFEKLSFSYYDKNNTGHMIARIISDLFDISELAHHGPEDVLISVFMLIGSFIILASINLPMTLILLFITLLMLLYFMRSNRRMQRVFMNNRKKIADVNAIVQDSLSGIRVVQSFSNEEIEQKKFDEGNHRFFLSKRDSYLTMGRYFAANSAMQGLLYVSVITAGGYFISRGSILATDVVIYLLYINMFLDPIKRLINFTEQFQKGFSGFKRMCDILDVEPEVTERENAKDAGRLRGDIEFKNVFFGYDEGRYVLSDISASIKAGETVALVGPSGVGKSTFCSLVPRFYDVQKGAVLIDGADVRDMTLSSLRKNVGVVQQDVYIFNSTIKENIAYGKPGASDEEIMEAARRANIHDYIMELENGYDTEVGERGVQLSGGQKQRLSIARVFLKNPPILILDEATSSLDNENERIIQQSLSELSRDRTTIIIAHRLSTVKNADVIMVITASGIEEQGNHSELMERDGTYARLYNMQFTDDKS